MDESIDELSQQQISDLKRSFYLARDFAREETEENLLKMSILSYSDNHVDFYFQGILLQHHHYALVLTEGLRNPDTIVSDTAGQAADVFRNVSHPMVQAPIAMADKFIELLKQQETRSDISLALAYANLQLTRLEFAVASRLLASKISYNYRENSYSAIQASAQAKALVKRIEVGLLMYSNPYSAISVMGMEHDRLKTIYPSLAEGSIRRLVAVVPFLLFLVNDTSITPSMFDRVASTFSHLFNPVDYEAKQSIDSHEILIRPPVKGSPMGLYIKRSTNDGKLPSVQDYTWEMKDQHIDINELPKRIVAWNGSKSDLRQSIKLSQSQTEQVLIHWLTEKMIDKYLSTSVMGTCFFDKKSEKDTEYLSYFFKKMIHDYLIEPPAHDLIQKLMKNYNGKHRLSRTLDDMASAFIKRFREGVKHCKIAIEEGVKLERLKKSLGENNLDIIFSNKSLPLSHPENARITAIIEKALGEAQEVLMTLKQSQEYGLIAVSKAAISLSPTKKKKTHSRVTFDHGSSDIKSSRSSSKLSLSQSGSFFRDVPSVRSRNIKKSGSHIKPEWR